MNVEITADQLTSVVDAAADILQDSISVRTSYSGRAMYGTECIGFVGGTGLEFALGIAFREVMEDELFDIGLPSTDSMGYSTIVYFTRLQLAEGEEYVGDDE